MNDTYEETVKSRFDDIIKDGPNLNTGILEITDNMIGWGNADLIIVKYIKNCPVMSRPYIEITDNSKLGFGDSESIGRFFRLGKKNKNTTENTIGKYGKGGYKAVIAMADIFELTTNIQGKKYICGTNFRKMEYENTWQPTIPLKISENNDGDQGSTFKIYFTFNIQSSMTFNLEELKRHIIRAYHNNPKPVQFKFISDSDEDSFKPNDYSPYSENVSEKTKYIYFTGDKDEAFVVSEEEKYNPYAVVKSYILKETITKNPYLGREGNKSPGIDFYRNNRLCNTRYPISKIGNVADLIQKGQMRGKRCHITVNFTDKKVSETRSFDDCIGVTTVKDIYEDDRMEGSIIKILENIAKECAYDYEVYTNKQKDGINDYMKDIQKYVKSLYNDELYLNDNLLDRYAEEMDKFTEYKIYYYDEEYDQIRFAKNKLEVKEQKINGEKPHRSNSQIIISAKGVLQEIKKAQKIKKQVIVKKNRIQEIMKEKGLDEKDAKNIYNQEKELEKIKKKQEEDDKRRRFEEAEEKIRLEKEKIAAQRKQAEDIENKKKEEERIKKEKEKRDKEEKKSLELAKQKEKEKLELEEKINKLSEDVMEISLDELRAYWIEQNKKIIMKSK
jgi:hypothetical protein